MVIIRLLSGGWAPNSFPYDTDSISRCKGKSKIHQIKGETRQTGLCYFILILCALLYCTVHSLIGKKKRNCTCTKMYAHQTFVRLPTCFGISYFPSYIIT